MAKAGGFDWLWDKIFSSVEKAITETQSLKGAPLSLQGYLFSRSRGLGVSRPVQRRRRWIPGAVSEITNGLDRTLGYRPGGPFPRCYCVSDPFRKLRGILNLTKRFPPRARASVCHP